MAKAIFKNTYEEIYQEYVTWKVFPKQIKFQINVKKSAAGKSSSHARQSKTHFLTVQNSADTSSCTLVEKTVLI